MGTLAVTGLPEGPSAAAAQFHAAVLPAVLERLAAGEDALVLVFPSSDHTHRGWRLSAVQSLAREHAPARINALASDDPVAIAAALVWLDAASGITGQYFPLDSVGAGPVLGSPA